MKIKFCGFEHTLYKIMTELPEQLRLRLLKLNPDVHLTSDNEGVLEMTHASDTLVDSGENKVGKL